MARRRGQATAVYGKPFLAPPDPSVNPTAARRRQTGETGGDKALVIGKKITRLFRPYERTLNICR